VEATKVNIGGGALPEADLQSVAIVFSAVHSANKLMKSFRELKTPIVGRIVDDRFMLDLKVIEPTDLQYVEQSIAKLLKLK
jgi:L-seryl-tRNA(Ser) seleniumtransferase